MELNSGTSAVNFRNYKCKFNTRNKGGSIFIQLAQFKLSDLLIVTILLLSGWIQFHIDDGCEGENILTAT